jgi:hypothetical protein
MDEQKPRMRRSRRNAPVLILTCFIQRADGSRMSSLISTIGYIRFPPLEKCLDTGPTPYHFSRAASAPAPVRWPCASPSKRIEEVVVERKE